MKVGSNKGFTLVEMLLAMAILAIVMAQVGNIIYNTTHLYRRSSGEINLQADAQQVVKLFEEVAVDCNYRVDTSTPNKIMILNENRSYGNGLVTIPSYIFELNPDTHELSLVVRSNGSDTVPQKVADNVKSIKIDVTSNNFKKSSCGLLTIEMEVDVFNNGSTVYDYSMSKDIYFRNHIGGEDEGTGGTAVVSPGGGGGYNPANPGSGTPTVSADDKVVEADILRYKVYNTKDFFRDTDATTYSLSTYEFLLCDADGNYITPDSNTGEYSGFPYASMDEDGYIDLSKIRFKDYSKKAGTGTAPYYFRSIENPNVYIKVSTNDLTIGMIATSDNDGLHLDQYKLDNVAYYTAAIPFEVNADPRTPHYVSATGISLADCEYYTVTPCIRMSADKLDKYANDMKFYKIKDYNNNEYPATDMETIVPLNEFTVNVSHGADGKLSSSLEASSLNSGEIRIMLGAAENSVNENNRIQLQYTFQNAYGYDGMFINEERNAFGLMVGKVDFSQTYVSNGQPYNSQQGKLDGAADFITRGCELFFLVDFHYEDGSVYTVKILADAKDSENQKTPTSGTEYSKAVDKALKSGVTSPTELLEESKSNGGTKYTVKESSSSSGGASAGPASGGSSADDNEPKDDEPKDGGESSGGGETSGGSEPKTE